MNPNRRALAVTAICLLAYGLARTQSLPFFFGVPAMVLGVRPAIGGFVIVELASFFIPPLSGYRRKGAAGRRKLNRLGWAAALLLAIAQTCFYVKFLMEAGATDRWSTDSIEQARWMEILGPVAAFLLIVAAFVGACILAGVMTRHGAANGFCSILVFESLFDPVLRLVGRVRAAESIYAGLTPENLAPLAAMAACTAAACWFLRRPCQTPARTPQGEDLQHALPPFPQGILPLAQAAVAVLFMRLWSSIEDLPNSAAASAAVMLCTLCLLTCVYFFCLGSADSVACSLAGRLEFPASLRERLVRQTCLGAAAMTGVWLVFLAPLPLTSSPASVTEAAYTIVQCAALASVLLDACAQWSFRGRFLRAVRLAAFDDPHVATYAQELLRSQGIESMVQALHFRRLFLIFNPLVKVVLYVPAEQSERAWELLRLEEFATV